MKKGVLLKLSSLESLYRRRPVYETKKLEARCREVGVDPPTYAPLDNNVVCWRLPPLEISAGGIVIPSEHASPHVKGIVMAVGPRARDVLFSNGIELGDVVIWARFSGWEMKDKQVGKELNDEYVVLKDRDILGSDDLAAELASGKAAYKQDPTTGRYCLVRKLIGGRKQKLLALAAGTDNPHEAAAARRAASTER